MTVTLGCNYRKYVRLISLSVTFTPYTIHVRVIHVAYRVKADDEAWMYQHKKKKKPTPKTKLEIMID